MSEDNRFRILDRTMPREEMWLLGAILVAVVLIVMGTAYAVSLP